MEIATFRVKKVACVQFQVEFFHNMDRFSPETIKDGLCADVIHKLDRTTVYSFVSMIPP